MGFDGGFEAGLGSFELAVAGVAKDRVCLLVSSGFELLRDVVDMRVCSEQVFIAVVVEVDEANTPAGISIREVPHLRGLGLVAKIAAALVTKHRKGLAIESRDHQIRLAVVVVIAKVGTHAGNGFAAIQQRHA